MESTKCGRRAPDRRTLTGEAGNVPRRQVMVVATAHSPEWASAWRTPDESGPNISRVMRTNFGDTTAKIFREYSDSLVLIFFTQSDKSFWIKEKDNDWEEVIITKADHYRSNYSEYYSNKKGYEKIVYSSFKSSENLLNNSYGLDNLPLSVEKLEEIGITSKLELDLSELSKTQAEGEKQKEKKNKSSAKCLLSRFHKNPPMRHGEHEVRSKSP